MATPKSLVYLLEPTHRMAKRLAFERVWELVPRDYVKRRLISELRIETHWGQVLECRSAESPDALRGPALDHCGLDEFASMDPVVWTSVIRPALADKEGSALFTGTPTDAGGAFHSLFERGQGKAVALDGEYSSEALGVGSWRSWEYTTEQGGWVSRSEIEAARSEMDEKEFEREFLARFTTLGNRVLYAYNPMIHDSEEAVDDGVSPLVLGMDFNVDPMTAIVGRVVRREDGKRELLIFDELVLSNSNTFEMGEELMARYGARPLSSEEVALREQFKQIEGETPLFRPRSLTVFPDASGRARKTSASPGETDFTILRKLGIAVVAPPRNPPIRNRINCTNAMFRAASGEVRAYVNPKCKKLRKTLRQWGYPEGSQVPDKTSGLDHAGDALGYLAIGVAPELGMGVVWSMGMEQGGSGLGESGVFTQSFFAG